MFEREPDRLEADLRAHEAAQDRAERSHAERWADALDAVSEDSLLAKVVEDAPLVPPLARAFRCLDRAFSGDADARDAVLQSVEQLRVQCVAWMVNGRRHHD
jgi:hypothetical protein